MTIADALEQIINIWFPRLFAEKAPPETHRSTATNNMLDNPPADETISAAADRAEAAGHREAAVVPPKLSTLSDNPPTTPNMSGQIQENGIVKYGSQPSKLIASSSPKIRAYDPVLAAAFIRAECDFYARTYEPNSPEIAARDWKTPFIHECQDRETAAMAWIADQWSTMPYKQYALCMAPYNRQLAEYGDTILAQQNMEYHQAYFMYEIIRSCMAIGWPMPEGYWTKEDREMYLDSKYGPKQ